MVVYSIYYLLVVYRNHLLRSTGFNVKGIDMTATEILMQEHRVIEQVLDCLAKLRDIACRTGELDTLHAKEALEFFRFFADRCHHGKEEGQLFPIMEARGFAGDNGPLAVMKYDHERGRRHVREMAQAVEDVEHGDAAGTERFVEHANGYIGLLREHIQREDHCLFPMADNAMSEEDQRALLESFARVEKEHMGQGTHEKYLRLADQLADFLDVERADLKVSGCCHCTCNE